MRALGLTALALLTLVSYAPLLALLTAGGVASALGCTVDEGSVHPCRVGGAEIGVALNTALVLGWLIFVTWPGMVVSGAIWLALFGRMLVNRVAARRARP